MNGLPRGVMLSNSGGGAVALAGMPRSPNLPPDGPPRSVTLESGEEKEAFDLGVNPFRAEDRVRELRRMMATQWGRVPRGRIDGRVVSPNGEPVQGAVVQAVGTRPPTTTQPATAFISSLTTMTDTEGRFTLRLLDDGEYEVLTMKPAHVDVSDAASEDPRPRNRVRIVNGVAGSVEMQLSRGGAISGTVVDEAGEPLQGVHVTALRVQRENGRMVAVNAGPERLTDDRGHYRVFGLPPGSYLVAASTDAAAPAADRARRRDYASVYYPGAGLEGAQPLDVHAGRDLTGMNLGIVPMSAARVGGSVFDHEDKPLAGRVQLFASGRSGAIAVEPLSATVKPDGTFEFAGVPAGDYVLQALARTGFGRGPEFGFEQIVVIDRDPAPVVVRTSEGATLEGRFVVEGIADPPMHALSIHAITTDLDRGPREGRGPEGLAVSDNGAFYLTGLRGPMRFTLRRPPERWYLKSFTIGGVDVTDIPFDFGSGSQTPGEAEIVLSPSGATIAGRVMDGPNTRATNYLAIAFSTARQLWFEGSRHVKQRRADGDGSFDVDGLPPGDYWIAAVDRLEAGDWQSPDVLDALVQAATRVTVREGQVYTTTLGLFRRAR